MMRLKATTPDNFGTINGKATNNNSYIRNIHISKNDYTEAKYLPKFKNAVDEGFTKIIPDIIFISAGFDARKDDPVAKFALGQGLNDKTYFKMAQYIKQKQQLNCPATPMMSIKLGSLIFVIILLISYIIYIKLAFKSVDLSYLPKAFSITLSYQSIIPSLINYAGKKYSQQLKSIIDYMQSTS